MRIVELRSDTFTRPTAAMRRAMADAEVGDDQYGEDPTANRLEERSAEVMGKEGAVFVPSGMMGNLCAVLAQTARGEQVVLGDQAHIQRNEVGAFTVLGGIGAQLLPDDGGAPTPEAVEAAIAHPAGPQPRVALVCLENSHNNRGGAVTDAARTRAIADVARRYGARVHLDGARLFNAAVALGVDARELAAPADTVQFCFSKGLGAPIGSIVCGDRATMERARKARKILGGAMRQAGVIAAAALIALETMRDRLAEDHANARRLAEGLAEIPGIVVEPSEVVTNIVAFAVDPSRMDGVAFQAACAERGVRIGRYSGGRDRLRAVTHFDVTGEDVQLALGVIGETMAAHHSARAVGAGSR